MPSGTLYSPLNVLGYGAKDLNAAFVGQMFTAAKGVMTTQDLQIVDDLLVDGGVIIADGVVFGDTIDCQVVDVDNVFGYGAGVVLGQYITNWYLTTGNSRWDFTIPYPAKLLAGLYVRINYHSIGTEIDVKVAINYKFHKVLR